MNTERIDSLVYVYRDWMIDITLDGTKEDVEKELEIEIPNMAGISLLFCHNAQGEYVGYDYCDVKQKVTQEGMEFVIDLPPAGTFKSLMLRGVLKDSGELASVVTKNYFLDVLTEKGREVHVKIPKPAVDACPIDLARVIPHSVLIVA